MRIPSRLLAATIAAVAITACNSEPPTLPGTPGAGVAVAIVGINRDSVGYTITLQVENRDTAIVGFGSSCFWGVETRSAGGDWTALPAPGACALTEMTMSPAAKAILSMPRQPLVAGTDVRVVVGWTYAYGPLVNNFVRTAPAAVQ
jgi:hypothetical protein